MWEEDEKMREGGAFLVFVPPLFISWPLATMANLITALFGITFRFFGLWVVAIPFIIGLVDLHLRDTIYTILALILPYRPKGSVIPPGRPGSGGIWPRWAAPIDGDSRSPCPGLNVLANHGILPRDGRRITYQQMSEAIEHAYNLSPSLADQLTGSAKLLDQGRGWIDLHDLNALNVVQHDASFTRPDIAFLPDQSYPHANLIEHMLSKSTDGKRMSLDDIAYFNGLRRTECKQSNGQYSLSHSFLHKFFGAGNAALMYSLFGGNVNDLKVWLTEERMPAKWEPKVRWSYGHTIVFAQKTSIEIEFNTNENQKLRPGDSFLPKAMLRMQV